MIASLRYNIHFCVEYIPDPLNIEADLSSRLQIQQFNEKYPKMTHINPTITPSSVMITADFLISKLLSEESRSSYKNNFLSYKQFPHDHIDKAANPLAPKL